MIIYELEIHAHNESKKMYALFFGKLFMHMNFPSKFMRTILLLHLKTVHAWLTHSVLYGRLHSSKEGHKRTDERDKETQMDEERNSEELPRTIDAAVLHCHEIWIKLAVSNMKVHAFYYVLLLWRIYLSGLSTKSNVKSATG